MRFLKEHMAPSIRSPCLAYLESLKRFEIIMCPLEGKARGHRSTQKPVSSEEQALLRHLELDAQVQVSIAMTSQHGVVIIRELEICVCESPSSPPRPPRPNSYHLGLTADRLLDVEWNKKGRCLRNCQSKAHYITFCPLVS